MSNKQYIKITLPKWWQTAIIFVVIILAFRVDAAPVWEFIKTWLKAYLER